MSPSPQILIRPLRGKREAVACARLAAASDPWLTLRRTAAYVLKQLTDPRKETYVAFDFHGNDPVGFIILDLNGPLGGYVQAIAVGPEWRGRGVGRKLMAFAEQCIFRESPNVFLCVASFNTAARRFYRRLGYERVGVLKNYVLHGYSEILMRKTIGPIGKAGSLTPVSRWLTPSPQ